MDKFSSLGPTVGAGRPELSSSSMKRRSPLWITLGRHDAALVTVVRWILCSHITPSLRLGGSMGPAGALSRSPRRDSVAGQ